MDLDGNKVIAVDFDGTLCDEAWPGIGAAHEDAIRYVKNEKTLGSRIILWTCRTNERLEEALVWCKERGLEFDAVNDNLPELKETYGSDCRKVFADIYLDDRAVPLRTVELMSRMADLEACRGSC